MASSSCPDLCRSYARLRRSTARSIRSSSVMSSRPPRCPSFSILAALDDSVNGVSGKIGLLVRRSSMAFAWRLPRRPAHPALVLVLCAAGLAASCARRAAPRDGGPAPPAKTAGFAAFAEGFTRDSLALSPPAATLAGLHRHRDPATGAEVDLDDELDDLSPEGTARKVRFFHGALESLDRDYPAASLAEQEGIDRDIMAAQCRLALLDLEGVRSIETNPTAAVESIGTALFFPVVFEYAPAADRGGDIVARLERVPVFVDQTMAALKSSAPIYTEVAIEENDGNRDVIQNALPGLYEKRIGPGGAFPEGARAGPASDRQAGPVPVLRPQEALDRRLAAGQGPVPREILRLLPGGPRPGERPEGDRKSTRLNSSHSQISYAVFCLKKK